MNTQILGPNAKCFKQRSHKNESIGWFGRSADSYTASSGPDSGSRFRYVTLVAILTVIVSPAGLAQVLSQEPTIGELQRQLDEMRSQMVKMQNRIAELEAARGISGTSSSNDPVLRQSESASAEAFRSLTDKTN